MILLLQPVLVITLCEYYRTGLGRRRRHTQTRRVRPTIVWLFDCLFVTRQHDDRPLLHCARGGAAPPGRVQSDAGGGWRDLAGVPPR
eukprot:2340184-Pyramimonas_sp.AAC.1